MARFRNALPQLDSTLFLTDGGIETTLVFRKGFALPHFAAFDLLQHDEGRAALEAWDREAAAHGMPVAISFTTETDGSLPSGQPLAEAIEQVDAATRNGPADDVINCAHPTHFEHVLETGAPWTARIRGLRANASRCSHDELDDAEELDIGNPAELGGQYRALRARFGHLSVLGGCCGTDERHVAAIADACAPAREAAWPDG